MKVTFLLGSVGTRPPGCVYNSVVMWLMEYISCTVTLMSLLQWWCLLLLMTWQFVYVVCYRQCFIAVVYLHTLRKHGVRHLSWSLLFPVEMEGQGILFTPLPHPLFPCIKYVLVSILFAPDLNFKGMPLHGMWLGGEGRGQKCHLPQYIREFFSTSVNVIAACCYMTFQR